MKSLKNKSKAIIQITKIYPSSIWINDNLEGLVLVTEVESIHKISVDRGYGVIDAEILSYPKETRHLNLSIFSIFGCEFKVLFSW